eukprot:8619007-Pyramimonas_sp.AAC.1
MAAQQIVLDDYRTFDRPRQPYRNSKMYNSAGIMKPVDHYHDNRDYAAPPTMIRGPADGVLVPQSWLPGAYGFPAAGSIH